jgi:hypothetical protein
MPQVPVYDQAQVQLQALPGVRQSAAGATPDAFGGAQARQLGQVAQGLGQAAQLGAKLQERQDLEAVTRVFTGLEDEQRRLLREGDNAIFARQGNNAGGATEEMAKWFEEAAPRYGADLTSPAQRRAFEQLLARQRSGVLDSVARHEAQEGKRALVESVQAKAGSSIEQAAAMWTNPQAVATAREDMEHAVAALAQTMGWEGETRERKLAEFHTLFHKRVIDAAAESNSDYAKAYYEQHKDQIDASARQAIERTLATAGLRADGQAHTDRIIAKGLSDEEALAEARRIERPELRDEVVRRVTARLNESEALINRDRRAAADDSWRLVVEHNNLDAIPVQTWDRLGGEQQRQIRDYLQARQTKEARGRDEDDYGVLDEVERRIQTGDLTDKAQLAPYEPYLRDATIRTLRTTIDQRGSVSPSVMQRAFEDRTGKTRTRWNSSQREEWLEFQRYILENVQQTRRPEDVDTWADRWFTRGYGAQTPWYGLNPSTYGAARTAGRDDYLIETPRERHTEVEASMELLRRAGLEVPSGRTARDEFYTRHQLEAQRFLQAQDAPVTPDAVAAFAYLRAAGRPTTMANIAYIAQQLR